MRKDIENQDTGARIFENQPRRKGPIQRAVVGEKYGERQRRSSEDGENQNERSLSKWTMLTFRRRFKQKRITIHHWEWGGNDTDGK